MIMMSEAERAASGATLGAPPRIERILLAFDSEPGSKVALAWARALAVATRARVRVATVVMTPQVRGYDGGGFAWWPEAASEHERLLSTERDAHEEAVRELERAGIATDGVLVAGAPVADLVRAADAFDADLVIMGSHNRGPMGRALLGSVADGVRNHTRASVLIAKQEPRLDRILVAVDGSPESRDAALLGIELASAWRSELHVIHVVEPRTPRPGEEARAEEIVARLAGLPTARGDATSRRPSRVSYALVPGRAAERIVQESRDRAAGLVILGSRGLGRLRSLVSGSVSTRVLHASDAPVLVVKGASREGTAQ